MIDRFPVKTGLDRLVSEPDTRKRFAGMRIGLLVNQAAVTARLEHAVSALLRAGLEIVRLFGPEHGLWGHAQDMEAVEHGRDPLSGLPVISLYGSCLSSLAPERLHLRDLDAILVDVPDIGTRYYTFAATAVHLARAAHEANVPVWVLDRPNPLGGEQFEGNLVEPGYESFVGAISVPNRHGLTLAELLRYAGLFGSSRFEVEWIPVSGWRRREWLDETGLPWAMPSPNMPTLDTATVYPGMCLLEATNLSEGRGTTRPFEVFGAPWVEAVRLLGALEDLQLEGVRFRPLVFQPGFQKWAGHACQGVQIHVTDRSRLRPYELGLSVLWTLRRLFPEHVAWRAQPYEFVGEIPAIDLLCGTPRVRAAVESGADLSTVLTHATAGAEGYPGRREAVRIYP